MTWRPPLPLVGAWLALLALLALTVALAYVPLGALFGLDKEDQDDLMVEKYELLRRLWREQGVTWSGTTLRAKTLAQKAEIIEGVRKTVWPHLATGLIRPLIDGVFPLEAAEKAHLRMQERLHIGKILLEVAPEQKTA